MSSSSMEYNADELRITERSSYKGDLFVSSRKRSGGLGAPVFGISVFLLTVFVAVVALLVNGFLPEPLRAHDAASKRFVAGNAFNILEKLSSIGPKVVGTYENEVLAVNLLRKEIEKVMLSDHDLSSSIEYDVQVVSGCFHLAVYKCYHNIQNIIVKISTGAATGENILVNAHFDSVPSSPGTSDDGVNCAVMLEILRVLAASKESLSKNVILLFNGAEEDGLLGSHGFITQHRWATNITAFINLDACGAGGREVLFQTGPKAAIIPQIYANSVPYPYGSVIGEELFQSGILPSDTDFRIFRDFGKLRGVDLAHYRNGYVYHTSSDNISYVSESVLQHTGDNILTLLRALIADVNLKSKIEGSAEQAVFFDLFGYFMICYSTKTAFVLNLVVVLSSTVISTYFAIRIFEGKKLTLLFIHFFIDFLCICIGLFAVTLVLHAMGGLLKWRGLTMLWYSNQWFVLVYYGVATSYTFATILRIRRDFIYSSLTMEQETRLFIIVVQMVITSFVLVCALLRIRSIYLFDIGLVAVSVSHVVVDVALKNTTIGIKVIAYVVCNLGPLMYCAYLEVQFFHLIIPMLARTGVVMDSEMLMWILCEVFVIVDLMYFIPLVILVDRWWKIELYIGAGHFLFIAAVLFGAFLSPFQNETAERFDVLHVNRVLARPDNSSKSANSGYLLVPVDWRASQTVDLLFGDVNFTRVSKFCREDLLCALPFTKNGYRGENYKKCYWTEAEKPVVPEFRKLHFNVIEEENFKTFNITLAGAAFAHLLVLPLNNAQLVGWSLDAHTPEGSATWHNQTVFVIRYVRGLENTREWSLWLKFNTSKIVSKSQVFKLAWSSEYRTSKTTHFTTEFQQLLNKFPSWTRVVASVADHEEYYF